MRRLYLSLLLLGLWPALVCAAVPARGDASRTQIDAALALPSVLREQTRERLPSVGLTDGERVQRLLDYMIADEGLGLRYREQPSLDVSEAYATRQVNCLSFTLLFVAMARTQGFDAFVQATDQALAMELVGDTLLRATHVNAGVMIDGREYTVDVGWRALLAGHPPKRISDAQAVAMLRNNEAVERLQQGDAVGAMPLIESALALDPDSAMAWSNAGVIRSRAGQRDSAEQAYLQALKLRRTHLGALSNLVLLYRSTGAEKQRLAYEARLERAQSQDPFTQFLIARQLVGAGAYEDAVARYRRAIRLMPDEPAFHRGLAEAYRLQGRDSAAERSRHRADNLYSRKMRGGGVRRAEPDAG
ncbi:tetratricopeptide repeat protein [Arenimonas sp.]|uniref:tetratricopeptide repeat protein n=1 Tax=Arenimonas sp. TaxID=1872635 RepID=UPI0039E45059